MSEYEHPTLLWQQRGRSKHRAAAGLYRAIDRLCKWRNGTAYLCEKLKFSHYCEALAASKKKEQTSRTSRDFILIQRAYYEGFLKL